MTARGSVPLEVEQSPRRANSALPLVLSMASLAVSVLCLALIAREPEHRDNHGLSQGPNLTETRFRESPRHGSTTPRPSHQTPPRNEDVFGARLFPGSNSYVYYDDENTDNTGTVAATVHGNLLVIGKVVEVDGTPNETPIDLPPPPPPPSWGTETHRDVYTSTSSSDVSRGTCALGLLQAGLKTFTKCEGCSLERFEAERGKCCGYPAKCVQPITELGCSRKFDEATCINSGCTWQAQAVQVSSAYEEYYTKCVVADGADGAWVSYSELDLDGGDVILEYRKRQVKIYEEGGGASRSDMDKPSYFLPTQLDLPPFEYHIFSSTGQPMGIDPTHQESNNPYKKKLTEAPGAPATFLFRAINDPVPITDPEPSLKATLEYTKSPEGYPMHLLQTENAVEYHANEENRPIVLTTPVKGVVSGTASWIVGGTLFRIAPSSLKKLVDVNAPSSSASCQNRVQSAVQCFETQNHALCIAELASSAYKTCCKLLYTHNIHIEC